MFYKLFHRRDLDKTFFQVLVSMIMVFVLLICVASPAHAVVGTTSILIPAVIAALESWGISVAADGLDGAEIAEWFHDKLTDWSTYASISLSNIVTGVKMTPLGQVLLNPFALNSVRLFADWFVQNNGLSAGGSSVQVVSGGTMFGGYQVYDPADVVVTESPLQYTFSVLSGSCWAFRTSNNVYFVSTSQYSLQRHVKNLRTGETWSNAASGGVLHNGVYNVGYGYSGTNVSIPLASFTLADLESSNKVVSSSGGTMSLVPSSDMSVPSASDVQDKDMLINTTLDVGADAAAWYDRVMQKVAANDFTATGTLTATGAISADQVIDQDAITESEGVVSWPDVTTPIGVSGLDEIFPFCIPFDVYHFFQALAADPVAPSFEIPFVIPNIVDYTFELDLSDFDQVAQILRTVELLAFCVGLAFVTRSFFIRG